MTTGKMIRLLDCSVMKNLPRGDALAYNRGDSPSVQEMKMVILRSLACRLQILRNFGKGNFSWQSAEIPSRKFFNLLGKYPKPRFLSAYWEQKSNGAYDLAVPPANLEAKPHDSANILRAKREAILCYFAKTYADMVALRPKNYREIYDPNKPQDPVLPRTIPAEELKLIFGPALDALKTHLPRCTPELVKVLKEQVIDPPLPFSVELPG